MGPIAILFRYLTRIKTALSDNPEIRQFVEQLANWFDEWVLGLRSNPQFDDECGGYDEDQKELVISNIQRDRDRALRMARRGQIVVANRENHLQQRSFMTEGLLSSLQRNCDYDGPGELRELGPRHDNDHVAIGMIRVAPTHTELFCEDDPFLPGNFFEAPHFHEPQSIERLLDIQFRLLREELV